MPRMNGTKYVNPESAVRAREWEQRFQKLPPEGGIIFVGVEAEPIEGGKSDTYNVRLGLSARLETGTGYAIIQDVLKDQMGNFTIRASVYRGAPGACRDEHPSKAHLPS